MEENALVETCRVKDRSLSGEWPLHAVDLSSQSAWRGTIRALRFDPASRVTSDRIAIRGIAITDSEKSPLDDGPGETAFKRGDVNAGDSLDIGVAIFALDFLVAEGSLSSCLGAGDSMAARAQV